MAISFGERGTAVFFDITGFFALSVLIGTISLEASPSCCIEPLEGKSLNKEMIKETDRLFKDKSCQTRYLEDAQKFQEEALQKTDQVLKDKDFQDIVASIGNRTQKFEVKSNSLSAKTPQEFRSLTPASLYIFVSFSCTEKALLNIAQDAKKWNATLVLRGFKEGSYLKTAKALQKIIQKTGQGFIIDPELFTLFAIQAVPTFVLSKPFQLNASERMQTPLHDRIQGHVSAQYALETFAKEGDLKDEAKSLLLTGETK